jgi:hypothetical protein
MADDSKKCLKSLSGKQKVSDANPNFAMPEAMKYFLEQIVATWCLSVQWEGSGVRLKRQKSLSAAGGRL